MVHLVCRDVTRRYGKRDALSGISFDVRAGTVVGLAGPNGSGKTTLFRLLSGLGQPSSGTITIDGGSPELTRIGDSGTGVFLGVDNLHPGRTVRETLRLVAFLSGQSRSRADDRLEWSGLSAVGSRLVKTLSLGMKVRLGLALATLRPTAILLLDEPMNGLDAEAITWVKSVMRQFAESAGIVVVSSHLLNELEAVADRVLILSRGMLVHDVSCGSAVEHTRTLLRVDDDARLADALSETGWAHRYSAGSWAIDGPLEAVGLCAFRAGIAVLELRDDQGESLEKTFAAVASGEYRPPLRGGAK